jgi:polar amino acid transport system substrate-binding protein
MARATAILKGLRSSDASGILKTSFWIRHRERQKNPAHANFNFRFNSLSARKAQNRIASETARMQATMLLFGLNAVLRQDKIILLGSVDLSARYQRHVAIGFLAALCAAVFLAFPSASRAEDDSNATNDLPLIKSAGILRVAITHFDIPPFHQRRPNGGFTGKDIEYIQQLGDALKVKIAYVDSPPTFDAVVETVAKGHADIGISKLSQTYDRLAYVRFSEPYITLHHALLYNRKVISALSNGGSPDSALRTFSGRIGVIGESAYVDFATANYPKATVVPFRTWEATIEALKTGRVDVVYRDEFEVRSVLTHDPAMHVLFGAAVMTDRRSFLAAAICDTCVKLEEFVNYFIAQHPRAYSLDELLTISYRN